MAAPADADNRWRSPSMLRRLKGESAVRNPAAGSPVANSTSASTQPDEKVAPNVGIEFDGEIVMSRAPAES